MTYETKVNNLLRVYVKRIQEIYRESVDITNELSFRPALQELLDKLKDIPEYAFSITIHDPSRQEFGAPDFKLKRGHYIVGYIETKPIDSDLDVIAQSEQIKKYISAIPNFILTNYLTFILFQEGKERLRAKVLNFSQLETTDAPAKRDIEDLTTLFDLFFQYHMPAIRNAKQMARALAKRCRLLNRAVLERLKIEEESPGIFWGLYETYKEFLMKDLKKEDFADLYAQSVTYGLLMASLRCQDEHFTKETVLKYLPPSVEVIKSLFRTTTAYSGELPNDVEWIIDDIISLLDASKFSISHILASSSPLEFIKDPLIFFYEVFLEEYNPEERELRGVYYTPDPIVEFIIRAVDYFLITKFNKKEGLLSDNVTLLDPALGTGTFLAHATRRIYNKLVEDGIPGLFPDIVREKVLKNFIGFELLASPYIIAHLKLGRLLEELGYKLSPQERLRVYLTNTLLTQDISQTTIPFASALAKEAISAEKVKKEEPILVIVGNPPYSGHSYNKGKEIQLLVDEYKKIDGKDIGEKNPKWLNDDYVKFIRWAEWKIAESDSGYKKGIIGFITNNAYIDNPTFRGMRKHLLDTFSEIYILNLHGNQRLRETCPDGSKDENVFDIMPGVAIIFLIKKEDYESNSKIKYIDVWGKREDKYRFLLEKQIEDLDFIELSPSEPYYLFKPYEETLGARLSKLSPSIKELMPLNSVGVATHRDHFAVAFEREVLEKRIRDFGDKRISNKEIKKKYNLHDTSDWMLAEKRRLLFNNIPNRYKEYLYRPFDKRWIFYHHAVVDRPRHEVLDSIDDIERNIALIVGRSGRAVPGKWDLVFISSHISDINIFYRGGGTVFPLYYKPSNEIKPNFAKGVIKKLSEKYATDLTPEEILYYIYGILNSPSYRETFAQELDIDFPKIPFPSSYEKFKKMSQLGERIAKLHLLSEEAIEKSNISFPVPGNHKVLKRKYVEEEGKLFINDKEYFGNITKEIWDYTVGGYQVLDKWLKDRRGRTLTLAEIETFRKICMAIKKTIEIYPELDEAFESIISEELYNPINKRESSLKDWS